MVQPRGNWILPGEIVVFCLPSRLLACILKSLHTSFWKKEAMDNTFFIDEMLHVGFNF